MTTLLDEDDLTSFKNDLHARCTYYRGKRFRECSWQPSGYCANCGRPQPSMVTADRRMTREEVESSPVLHRLAELAREFDNAAAHYSQFAGEHNALLRSEANRAAGQIRLVANLVRDRIYSQSQGADWVRAAWRVVSAIGRSNIT